MRCVFTGAAGSLAGRELRKKKRAVLTMDHGVHHGISQVCHSTLVPSRALLLRDLRDSYKTRIPWPMAAAKIVLQDVEIRSFCLKRGLLCGRGGRVLLFC